MIYHLVALLIVQIKPFNSKSSKLPIIYFSYPGRFDLSLFYLVLLKCFTEPLTTEPAGISDTVPQTKLILASVFNA